MANSTLAQIVQLASDQFQVTNATENILAIQDISEVFSPQYHGPKNIPICANDVVIGNNFTHFPIVTPKKYYLFLTLGEDKVKIVDMHYNGPSQQLNSEGNRYLPIELTPINDTDLSGSPFKQGFYSDSEIVFNQSDPQPIAIHFETLTEDITKLDYIIV